MKTIEDLQNGLMAAWSAAYNLAKETDDPEIKKAFTKIECVINSLECDVLDIKKELNK